MSAFSWVKTFFSGNAEAAPRHHPAAHPLKLPTDAPRVGNKLQAGNLQMIDLQSIRDALGEEWPQRRETIHRIMEGTIRRRLDIGDMHYRLENDEYLVLFVQLSHIQAKARAAQIAREAEQLIFGELPQYNIRIASTVAEVDRDLVNSRIGSLAELVSHVKTAGQAADAESLQGEVTLFDDEPAPDFMEVEAAAPSRPVMMGAGPDLADLDQSLDMLFQKKTSAAYLKECQASFYPNFSTRRRSFPVYTVHVTHIPTGRAADASDPMLEDPEELDFLLDRYRLTTALLGLHRMVTGGHKGLITIPVSFATLATSRTRNIYLGRFRDLPAGLFRSLCIVIANIPDGTPASRVSDAFNYIQRYCTSRILHIAPDPKLVDLYAATGCHGFSTTPPPGVTDPGQKLQLLGAFAKRVGWYKLESVLYDIASPDDINIGTAAGFSYLIGDAVAPLLVTPGHRQNLRADHIPHRPAAAPGAAPGAVGVQMR
jgi:hypothetical protein